MSDKRAGFPGLSVFSWLLLVAAVLTYLALTLKVGEG